MVCIMSGSGHDFDGCSFRIFWNNKYFRYFKIFWNILAAVFDRFIVPKVWHKMVCIMSGSGHDFDGSSHYLTRAEGTLPHILTCDILLSCYILSCYILLSCFLFQSRNVHCGKCHRLITQPYQILLREVAWVCTPTVDNLLCLWQMSETVKMYHWNGMIPNPVHKTIMGDPNNGLDELEPTRSYF